MNLVATHLHDKIGTITIDHPQKRNSISEQLVHEILAAFDTLEQEGANALVLRAMPGVRVWSAGHDISELPLGRRDPLGYQDALEQLIRRVQDCHLPVIALVEGSVWGGACDLCIACDIIICGEDSTFAITPAKIGLPYNASGLMRFLNVAGPHKAREMFFTARPISAQDALNARMVNHVVPRDQLDAVTYDIAGAIAQNAPMAVRVLKRQFRLLLKGQMLSSETFEQIQGMRREVYDSHDYHEGIQAFLDKRKPDFEGH